MSKQKIPITILDNCSNYIKSNFKSFSNSEELANYLRKVISDNKLNINEIEFGKILISYCHNIVLFNKSPFQTNEFQFDSFFNRKT